MPGPAHRRGRVDRHRLAGDEPIEQMADRGEPLLDTRRRELADYLPSIASRRSCYAVYATRMTRSLLLASRVRDRDPQPELLALAKYPNVAVKATGQAGYAEDEYPFRSLHPHLHRCFDAFGPERMFWGTDITRMPCSWRQCVTLFTEELPWLKGRDLELVIGEALCNWIGWPLPPGQKVTR
jgi:hypothetical protein